ncbi:MAG: sulfurtransferase TusA family protein [Candidatus Rokuibacteriota bacterium]
MERGDELQYGIDECALYPLFTPELIDLMRRLVPRERWAHIARAVTFTARRGPGPAAMAGREAAADRGDDPAGPTAGLPTPDLMWDFGDTGCEDGALLKMRSLVARLAPGEIVEVRSTDPGAPEDLPAWCRLTGHEFLGAHGHRYFVRKR